MCRVGPGTGMGAAMRGIGYPALSSAELPQPAVIRFTWSCWGKTWLRFGHRRESGLLDRPVVIEVPHCCSVVSRGGGIRCIYHGWKYSVDGTVWKRPNVPDAKFKDRIRARAIPFVRRRV